MIAKYVALSIALIISLAGTPATNISVLCYHQIAPRADNIMTTTPELFEQQMQYLKEHGYRPVSISDAAAFLRGKKKLEGKPVLITFDDGYDGIYKYAFPVLKKYHYPAAVFLVVGMITDKGIPNHLNWKQVKSMQVSGLFHFGSHTYALHKKIADEIESGMLTEAALSADLRKSREVLKKRTGVATTCLAWPYGSYNSETVKCAKASGFTVLLTTDYGPNHPGDGTLGIRRIRLSSEYDTVTRMEEKLNQYR